MTFLYILFPFAAISLLMFLRKKKDSLPLPPGPPRLPIIGNAHQMPKEEGLRKAFDSWRNEYGDIFHLSILGKPYIVISSAKALMELLDKKGAIYSDRPTFEMVGELVGYKDCIPLHTYDQTLRESRKLMASHLAASKIASQHPFLERNVLRYLLLPVLNAPEHFSEHVNKIAAASLFYFAYGHTVTDWPQRDPLVDLSHQCLDDFQTAIKPGDFLVDVFPFLKYIPDWFPGASFKSIASGYRKTLVHTKDSPYNRVREDVKKGNAVPCLTSYMLEKNPNPSAEEEEMYKWVSVAAYTAGNETQEGTFMAFFLAMLLYPDEQKKAQKELDTVTGGERLPTFADRDNLPYLNGLLKEIFRKYPIAPLGLPHRNTKDDVYEGYLIPEGSTLMPNITAVLNDPSLYPSPSEFKPERYLSETSRSLKFEFTDNILDSKLGINPDPYKFVFGFGRRICPGLNLADAALFILAATILSAFDVLPALDAEGKPEAVEAKFSTKLISSPLPFRCRVLPRSQAAAEVVKNAASKL